MRIRIKTKAVVTYLIILFCGTVFFGIYFLTVPQLPHAKSRNGIERAARDRWSKSDIRRHHDHEGNSPLHFRGAIHNPGVLSVSQKGKGQKEKVVDREEQMDTEQQHKVEIPDREIVIPPSAFLSNMSWEELSDLYHSYTQQIQIKCSSIERRGKVTDGGWEMCDDKEYKPSAPCLVYSFGIGDDFSFDDAVAKHYGCEVHSFDPSMKSKDHQRPSSVHFHALGLADFTGVTSEGWKMSTLANIQKTLGHSQKPLAVLKLDIEEWEWKVLPSLLKGGHLSSVGQLLVELHQCDGCSRYNPNQLDKEPPKERYVLALNVLRDLYALGFRLFWFHQNRACEYLSKFGWIQRNACCELHFVRTDGRSSVDLE